MLLLSVVGGEVLEGRREGRGLFLIEHTNVILEDAPLVKFIYLYSSHARWSYRRRFRALLCVPAVCVTSTV